MPDIAMNKAMWADDIEEEDALPPSEIIENADGTKTVISYRFSEEGRKIKTTRKIRITTKQEIVPPAIAERKKWVKFGAEKGKGPGPDLITTTVGENIPFRLSVGYKQREEQDEAGPQLKSKPSAQITCRICNTKGNHYTARCPYKDTLDPLADKADSDFPNPTEPEANTTGKYVAVHLRAGGSKVTGTSMSMRDRDDLSTLRVTNLCEDTTEDDLRSIFSRFGPLSRVYLARDMQTGRVKGFAFISYHERSDALRAAEKMDGYGYLNLIIRVELAKRQ